MCGRYRLSRRKQLVEEYFGADSGQYDWNPHYNIAPTQLADYQDLAEQTKPGVNQVELIIRPGCAPTLIPGG
jgi:putative SOS response-associated peptidase YedK